MLMLFGMWDGRFRCCLLAIAANAAKTQFAVKAI